MKNARLASSPPPLQQRSTPQRSKKGRPVLSSQWQQWCALSESQVAAVDALRAAAHSTGALGADPRGGGGGGGGGAEGQEEAEEQQVRSVAEFYDWYDALSHSNESDTQESGVSDVQCAWLSRYGEACNELLSLLTQASELLMHLREQYDDVHAKTRGLQSATEALLAEKEALERFCDAVHQQLEYFKQLDLVTAQFHHSDIQVTDARFKEALEKLDESLNFIRQHAAYKESDAYLLKFSLLQSKALALLKDHVVSQLRSATEQIALTLARGENTESESLYYVHFRAVAPDIRQYVAELEKRSAASHGDALLRDAQLYYLSCRKQLCSGQVMRNLNTIADLDSLAQMVHSGCSYLVNLSTLEFRLYHQFFTREGSSISKLLTEFGSLWLDQMRPAIIKSRSISELCKMVDALRVVRESQVRNKGAALLPLQDVLDRMERDVQERLIFLTQTYVRDEIACFKPSELDLDYPQKLLFVPESVSDGDSTRASWYPTLQETLDVLSALYVVLDKQVFQGLAQELIAVCCATLTDASDRILAKNKTVDGQLFLVKHLLLLKQRMSHFHVDSYSIQETSYDFSSVKHAVSGVLRNGSSLLALNNENPLFRAMKHPIPAITVQSRDAAKELELLLLSTVDAFVAFSVGPAVREVSSFLTQSSAYIASHTPFIDKNFAAVPTLHKMLQGSAQALQVALPEALAAIKLYLPPSHYGDMFQAVQHNVAALYKQLLSLLENEYSEVEPQDAVRELKVAVAGQLEFVKETCTEMISATSNDEVALDV